MLPIAGRCYFDHPDWWSYVVSIPAPRFVVLQDVDKTIGFGALFGEIHANICAALGCCALLTNGAVRDLPAVRSAGIQTFAGSVSVSHAYAHIVEFGEPVEIDGLKIAPGTLLHGDRHGVLSIPPEVATQIPEVAEKIMKEEKEIVDYCRSGEFALDQLAAKLSDLSKLHNPPTERRNP